MNFQLYIQDEKELFEAIKNVHGVEPRFVGIGGGTVAAGLRNAGIDAVVWSTMDELAHQPNEYAIIKNIADCNYNRAD